MFLERLELTDFRNYAGLRLEFGAPLTLLGGANAQGKTNLLEAIALLALARSPRAARDSEMLRWHAAEATVRGEARRSAREPVAISLTLRRDGSKTLRVDGQPRPRLADGIGELAVVYFGPNDLRLVSGSPGDRREFLNTCIGQACPPYLAALGGYRHALRQRNGLLKQAQTRRLDEDLLLSLDDELAERAAALMLLRVEWVARLATAAGALHGTLSGGAEQLEVTYQPHVTSPASDARELADAIREQLIVRRNDELRRGVTLLGPHRDDLGLKVNGVEARTYGSQGQQRTAALSLKLGELRVMTATLGEPPLLLLDDVLSELDEQRRAAVLALSTEAEQVLLTAASGETLELPAGLAVDRRLVESGTVREI